MPITESYKTILHSIAPNNSILFGCSFELPSNELVLYKEHMYALFLLLYFHGEPMQRRIVVDRIAECRDMYEFGGRNGGGEGDSRSAAKSGASVVDMFDFLERELKRNDIDPTVFHSLRQRQYIRKAFKAIFEMQRKLTIKSQMNLIDFSKLAASLIDSTCSVHDFLDFQIIQFHNPEFQVSNLDIFIEINKRSQSYKYIKKRQDMLMTAYWANKEIGVSQDENFMFRRIRIKREESIMLEDPFMMEESIEVEGDQEGDDEGEMTESVVYVHKSSVSNCSYRKRVIEANNEGYPEQKRQQKQVMTPVITQLIKRSTSMEEQPKTIDKTQATIENPHEAYTHKELVPQIENIHDISQQSQTHRVNFDQMEESVRLHSQRCRNETPLMKYDRKYDDVQFRKMPTSLSPLSVFQAGQKKFVVLMLEKAIQQLVNDQYNKSQTSKDQQEEEKTLKYFLKLNENNEGQSGRKTETQLQTTHDLQPRNVSSFKNICQHVNNIKHNQLKETLKIPTISPHSQQPCPETLQFSSTLRSRKRNSENYRKIINTQVSS